MAQPIISSTPASQFLTPDSVAATLQALVRIDSVNPSYGGPAGGEAKVIAWVRNFLSEINIESETWEASTGRPNMTATIEGRDPTRTLVFETHVDTVSTSGMSIDPLSGEIRDGRLWGRGSTDAKAQVAAMLHAFAAIAAGDEKPAVNIELILAVDEEFGFTGAKEIVRRFEQRQTKPIGAVIGEPTDLEVVVAHKGIQRWWIEVEGKSAHSAKPHLGINAIEMAAHLITMIQGEYAAKLKQKVHPLLGSPTINVSKIEGGTQVNLVPQRTRILLDRRTLPDETRQSVIDEFETMIRELSQTHDGFAAKQEEAFLCEQGLDTSAGDPFVATAISIAHAMGSSSEASGVDFGTDGSIIATTGIPTIVIGPGSIDQAHTEDEWMDLEQLHRGAVFYHKLMLSDHPS